MSLARRDDACVRACVGRSFRFDRFDRFGMFGRKMVESIRFLLWIDSLSRIYMEYVTRIISTGIPYLHGL